MVTSWLALAERADAQEKVLYTFTDEGDGGSPYAGLVFDGARNLFGTAPYGGIGDGVVFELAKVRARGDTRYSTVSQEAKMAAALQGASYSTQLVTSTERPQREATWRTAKAVVVWSLKLRKTQTDGLSTYSTGSLTATMDRIGTEA